MTWPNTTYWIWIDTSGKIETQLHKITKQASCLKKVTYLIESFFDLLDSDWFGSWGPWV